MLIKLSQKVADLPYLYMLTLRYIYEKDKMKVEEIRLMQDSIVKWTKKLDPTEDETYIIQRISYMLDREEKGLYNERKENFKKHRIDWRGFHKIPKDKYAIGAN